MEKDLLELQRLNLSNLLNDLDQSKYDEALENFKTIYTYDAVGLEGRNKIPYDDVVKLLKVKKLPDYSERDQKEVINHYRSFEMVINWIKNEKVFDEELLKDLHEELVRGILPGGLYRNVNIQIVGATHQPPDYVKVYDRMKRFFDRLDMFEGSGLERAVYAHAEVSKIHPFLDGNGRLARLIMNYFLLKEGYLPVTIPLNKRADYFNALETFKVEKTLVPLVDFVKDLLVERYEQTIEQLEKWVLSTLFLCL